VAPTARPLDWATEVKPGLRLTEETEQDWIESILVRAAEGWAESITGRALITQTWQLRLPYFPPSGGRITIPNPPLQSISSITYVDPNGDEQTWATALWTSDAPSGEKALHGHVWPAYGAPPGHAQRGRRNLFTS
jgi:uncharacterized phiE125 gp8 family phage protein